MQNVITRALSSFRIADREIFNNYFRIDDPWDNQEIAWGLVERFNDLEIVLFQKMVSEIATVQVSQYGEPQEHIFINSDTPLPALINREINSGYWDYPTTKIPQSSEIQFISFFDWDAISIRDNKYIRVKIASCPSNHSLSGKQALIESMGTSFHLRSQDQV